MGKIKDLVGTKYNNFEILDYKRENSRSYLFVKCPICHNKKWVRKDSLDNTMSCGCLSKTTQFKAKNLAGKRFGRLIAIEPVDRKRDKNGSIIWRCQCDCKNFCEVPQGSLQGGRVRSCGCIASEFSKKIIQKAISESNKTCVENTKLNNLTAKTPSNNTSGVKGVHWDNSRKKWVAQIFFQGQYHALGRYSKKEDAIKARKTAEEELFNPILERYSSLLNKPR